jgi:DNA-binding SARP family transcriptional activator
MTNGLEINLFGGFCIKINGRPHSGSLSQKGRALLVFLALEPDRPHLRAALACLLWPNQPEHVSRTNLRQTLHRLVLALADEDAQPACVSINPYDITLHSSCCFLDTANFHQLLLSTSRQPYPGEPLGADSLEKFTRPSTSITGMCWPVFPCRAAASSNGG